MTITKAPQELDQFESTSVFLAGSIEMGAAEDWQAECGRVLEKAGFHVLNPRRDDWDSSWEQSINNPQFREQVEWELKYLEACSYILLYLSPRTMSPISLLELGLHAHRSKHLVVCCPEGFWRRGNVEIVCVRYGIALLTSLDAAVATLREISAVHGDHPEEPANKTIKP